MTKRGQNFRYVLVAMAICLMAIGTMGLPNAYGVFYTPMSEALGAGRGAVTLHFSISNLAIGLFTPVVAWSLSRGHKMRNILLVAMALIMVPNAPTKRIFLIIYDFSYFACKDTKEFVYLQHKTEKCNLCSQSGP